MARATMKTVRPKTARNSPVPTNATPQGRRPRQSDDPRNKRKVHIYFLESQFDELKRTSNVTTISIASLVRIAVNHWLTHRDPAAPLQFTCAASPLSALPAGIVSPGAPSIRNQIFTRASAPPEGEPDARRARGRMPFRIEAEDSSTKAARMIPYDVMDRLGDLMFADEKKNGTTTDERQAKKLAGKVGLSFEETMAAIRGLHEGYLDDENEDNVEDGEDEDG